jgi:hypothetical protein
MLNKDKRGVFGLESVQAFFAIILGIALLAYVIVTVMGTLNQTTILPSSAGNVVANESILTTTVIIGLNTTGYDLALSTVDGFSSPVITAIWNVSGIAGSAQPYNNTILLGAGNFSLSSTGNLTSAWANTDNGTGNVSVSYTYTRNTASQSNANSILGNTSAGISGFFGNISPVFAILAVLVIILVLVVLVRVVQAPSQGGSAPQL